MTGTHNEWSLKKVQSVNSWFQTTKWALKATKQENILLTLMSRSSKEFLLRETECHHTAPIICYDLKAASTATLDTNAKATIVWPLGSPLLSQMLLLLLLSLQVSISGVSISAAGGAAAAADTELLLVVRLLLLGCFWTAPSVGLLLQCELSQPRRLHLLTCPVNPSEARISRSHRSSKIMTALWDRF